MASQAFVDSLVKEIVEPGVGQLLDLPYFRELRAGKLSIKRLQGWALQHYLHNVALLKGFGTLIAHPDGRMALCGEGHPAMATGGLGDILTGIIAALLGQGLAPFEAACLGAWLHGRAGAELGRALPLDRPARRRARFVLREHVQHRVRIAVEELHDLAFDLDALVGPIDGRERVMRDRRRRRQCHEHRNRRCRRERNAGREHGRAGIPFASHGPHLGPCE